MGKQKGIKISQVKRKNHMRNKLGKRGKLKKNKKSSPHSAPQNPQPPQNQEFEGEDDIGEEMLKMVDDDDVHYLQKSMIYKSYEILKNIRYPAPREKRSKRDHSSNIDDKWERLYDQEMNEPDVKRTKLLLPIKTKQGLVMQSTVVSESEEKKLILERETREKEKEEERKRKKLEKKRKKKGLKEGEGEEDKNEEDDEEAEDDEEDELKKLEEEYKPVLPRSLAAVDLLACREELLRKRKFQIGLLAAGLLENPEMKVRNFKFLLEILDKDNSEMKVTVRKLAAVSLMEVFKDLLPSYQIKHQELPAGVKLKKTTMTLQNYESSLLKAYKMYLQSLEKMTSSLKQKQGDKRLYLERDKRLGLVAVRCMTELLVNHPYFNFAANIAQALVQFLDNKFPDVREIVFKGLSRVLKEDKRGEISLHIVRRINQLVRRKNHSVHPELLRVLLALPLRDINLDAEKEVEIKNKKLQARKKRILNMSKRERKRMKRMEEVEKELLETKAEENKQAKQKHLTEVTKTIFMIFFRVLKCAPSSKLLSATLEGLAKFAHCINLEFFQDIVNVLDSLLVHTKLGHMEQLHCVETVFTILSGQGEALNIDPLRFYSHLYHSLLAVHAGDSSAGAKIVLRVLDKAVIARRRKLTVQRLLAFTKRLSTLAPNLLHDAALGYLTVIRNTLMQSSACDILLDTDSSHGDGIYQPELPEPEYCGAGASVLWELLLMKRHYHPDVQLLAKCILNHEESTLPPDIAKLSPCVLAETYDCSQMAFHPAVPPPQQSTPRAQRGRQVLLDEELAQYVQNIETSVKFEDLQTWEIPECKSSVSEFEVKEEPESSKSESRDSVVPMMVVMKRTCNTSFSLL